MRNRAYRRHQKERKRKQMVKLDEICHHYPYPFHPMCMDEHGKRTYHFPWDENPILYYKRAYRSHGRGDASGYLKKVSNRKIRKSWNFKLRGSNYKKVYDYWWMMY